MSLQDLTVEKFVELWNIQKADYYATELDREVAILVCITGKPEDYFLNLSIEDFKKQSSRFALPNLDDIKPQAKRYIKANGNYYAPGYDFNKLTAGQFIDATHFLKDQDNIIENLHLIMASFCVPTKRKLFGRVKLPYLSTAHNEVAEDFKKASILEVYAVAVFFSVVLKSLLTNTGDYLTRELLKAKTKTGSKITEAEKAAILNILQMFGDGITARKK